MKTIEVILYSRSDCHLCQQAEADLKSLQAQFPHHLTVVDVDSDPQLQKTYGFNVPVIEIGPYKMGAPIDLKALQVTLATAQDRQNQIEKMEVDIQDKILKLPVSWTRADAFNLWLSKHWLAVFNLFILIYVGLPFLAPTLARIGAVAPAAAIYRIYSLSCHQLAFRSWFLYGEQAAYPLSLAEVEGPTYEEVTGLPGNDLWAAREYIGAEQVGYKVALCERDIAIYLSILLFGLLYAPLRKVWPRLPWYVLLPIALLPMGLDGVSQLLSQPPFSFLPIRESTPLLRTLTGGMFGFFMAWFAYPVAQTGMYETMDYMQARLERFRRQQQA